MRGYASIALDVLPLEHQRLAVQFEADCTASDVRSLATACE